METCIANIMISREVINRDGQISALFIQTENVFKSVQWLLPPVTMKNITKMEVEDIRTIKYWKQLILAVVALIDKIIMWNRIFHSKMWWRINFRIISIIA